MPFPDQAAVRPVPCDEEKGDSRVPENGIFT